MKRVLIFSLNYYPHFIGGAEVAIKEITDRIPQEDIEFHMITLRFDSTLPAVERVGSVLVHRIGFAVPRPSIADLKRFPLHLNKHYFQIAAYLKARSLHKTYQYDGVWAMMAHAAAIPAGLMKRAFPKVRYMLTLQEGDPPERIERLMRPVWPLFVQGFRSADALQAISTFLLAWGKRMGFAGTAEVIPNGVDAKHFSQTFSETVIEEMRSKLNKKPGDVFLVTTSRLVYKNAVDDIIRALALLRKEVSLVICGIGPDEAMLRSLAHELGVLPRIHFLGQVDHAALPLVLRACDIFVRPPRSEGMGNSFIEAFAATLPVVATQEGGIIDFLFDEKRNTDKEQTGWAVDAGAPEQIAEAVNDILARPEHTRSVTDRARRLAFEQYDWNLVAERIRGLFDRVLAGR